MTSKSFCSLTPEQQAKRRKKIARGLRRDLEKLAKKRGET